MLREWPKENCYNKYSTEYQPRGKRGEGQNHLGYDASKKQKEEKITPQRLNRQKKLETGNQKAYNSPRGFQEFVYKSTNQTV